MTDQLPRRALWRWPQRTTNSRRDTMATLSGEPLAKFHLCVCWNDSCDFVRSFVLKFFRHFPLRFFQGYFVSLIVSSDRNSDFNYIYIGIISRFYLNRMNSAFRSIDSIRETSKQKEFNGFERYFSLNMKEDAIENGGFCIGESFYPLIILLELWRNAMPFNISSRKSNTRKIVFLERDVAIPLCMRILSVIT